MPSLVFLLACATQPMPVETSPMEKTQQDVATNSTPGPPLDGELLAWLESSTGAIQLPIEIHRATLGVQGGTVLGADLELQLDDTRMGIGLADQLASTCPDDGPCRVWLEGEWGATLPGPDDTGPTLSVRRVVGAVEGEPRTARIPSR